MLCSILLDVGTLARITDLRFLSSNSNFSVISRSGFVFFFFPTQGSCLLFLWIFAIFQLDARHCEFYFPEYWIFLQSFIYSWALFELCWVSWEQFYSFEAGLFQTKTAFKQGLIFLPTAEAVSTFLSTLLSAHVLGFFPTLELYLGLWAFCGSFLVVWYFPYTLMLIILRFRGTHRRSLSSLALCTVVILPCEF